jgi:UDP-N-acetylmuramoyl-L-alanyl-D-glutamate--2,6-diaminopimelate ligase
VTQLSHNLSGVSLRELLADASQVAVAPNLRVTSCTSDCRQVQPGDVYVALTGADQDGHDEAVEAARRGAAALICERPLPVFDVPQWVVTDSRSVFGRLCQALVGNPSRQMKVIGVTGTHGKTTVARLLTAIFREAGGCAATLDSFGYWDGWQDHSAQNGSLAPPLLARSLAQMAAAGTSHAMIEVSSRELSQQVLAGVRLDATCITHVGRNHLNWHGSVENYRLAKQRIFEYLDADGVAILNADDPVSVRMLCDVNRPALTFGLKNPAEITAEIIEQQVNEQTFVLSAGDDSAGVRTAIIGDHHVYNCLTAATTALAYGVDLAAVARGLEAVDQLPGRMERVACGQDFAVFIDAADTPDTLRACLRSARHVTAGRLICVFSVPSDRDAGDWPAMGRVAGAMADVSVVTNDCGADVGEYTCAQVRAGFADHRKARIIASRTEAIAMALAEATSGDTVVIAGMGERTHGAPYEGNTPVNDCEIVHHMLSGRINTQMSHRMAA